MAAEDKILDKVRKMLDRANHAGTSEHERDLCIKMADDMMAKHGIEQAQIDAAKDPSERRKPVHRQFKAWDTLVWRVKFQTIMTEIARTAGVRASVRFDGDVNLVGMSDDVNYVEMLWTQTYLAFLSKLEPTWDRSLSFEHNVYNFKLAGTKWPLICARAREAGDWVDWPDGGRLKRAYERHCKILGEEPTRHTQRHDVYRESFAEGFETEICHRLRQMRRSRAETTEKAGAGLVLVERDDVVAEAYFSIFPDQRPEVVDARRKAQMEEWDKQRQEEEAARTDMLNAMTDKQRAAFLDKEAREERAEAARNERYWEQRAHRDRPDSDGRRAGRRAGASVDLTRTSGATNTASTAGEL